MDIRRVTGWILVAIGAPLTALFAIALVLALFGAAVSLNVVGVLSLIGYLFPAAVTLAVALVGWKLARAPRDVSEPERRAVTPVGIVAPEDVADLRFPLRACPDCGFVGVRTPGIREGLWPGGGETGDRLVCPRCGHQGIAASFDSADEYAAFVRALHEATPT